MEYPYFKGLEADRYSFYRMFMIYQINDAEKNREYRCRSYAYQIEHGFMITTDNYEISYCGKASQGLVPAKIRENMESLNPDKFKIRKFGVSDVIAITAAGKTAFYYVDKEALVMLSVFLEVRPIFAFCRGKIGSLLQLRHVLPNIQCPLRSRTGC